MSVVPEKFDNGTLGEFHETSSGFSIGVSPDLPPDVLDLTLAHEVIHAWLRVSGIVEFLKHEEVICNVLAPLLIQLLKEVQNGNHR